MTLSGFVNHSAYQDIQNLLFPCDGCPVPPHVIQVKMGGGKGIVPQIQASQQLTDLPVIGFDANEIVGTGQSFKSSVLKNAQQNEFTTVNNLDDLMNILRPRGN